MQQLPVERDQLTDRGAAKEALRDRAIRVPLDLGARAWARHLQHKRGCARVCEVEHRAQLRLHVDAVRVAAILVNVPVEFDSFFSVPLGSHLAKCENQLQTSHCHKHTRNVNH